MSASISSQCGALLRALPTLHLVQTLNNIKLASELSEAVQSVSRETPL